MFAGNGNGVITWLTQTKEGYATTLKGGKMEARDARIFHTIAGKYGCKVSIDFENNIVDFNAEDPDTVRQICEELSEFFEEV